MTSAMLSPAANIAARELPKSPTRTESRGDKKPDTFADKLGKARAKSKRDDRPADDTPIESADAAKAEPKDDQVQAQAISAKPAKREAEPATKSADADDDDAAQLVALSPSPQQVVAPEIETTDLPADPSAQSVDAAVPCHVEAGEADSASADAGAAQDGEATDESGIPLPEMKPDAHVATPKVKPAAKNGPADDRPNDDAAAAPNSSAAKANDATVAPAKDVDDAAADEAKPKAVETAPAAEAKSDDAASVPQPPVQSPAPAEHAAKPQPAIAPEHKFAADNVDNIVTAVRGELMPKGGSMHIRLDPPQLGQLHVNVELKDGILTASFETANGEAAKLLTQNLSALKSSLEQAGVNVDKIAVHQMPAAEKSSSGNNADTGGDRQQQAAGQQSQQQFSRGDQQRRELLQQMWKRLGLAGDPLDIEA